MRDGDIKRKVEVFISSNINEEYKLIRESLRVLLLRTGMCEVYSFEEEFGSSRPVVSSYLDKIERSDLVIFLLDNADTPKEGTLKEYRRCRELNKKCIFLFCNETQKESTELQKEIMSLSFAEKYKEVSLKSHMAEEAYKSVVNDVVDIYHSYCFHQCEFIDTNRDTDFDNPKEGLLGASGTLINNSIQGSDYLYSMIMGYAVYHCKLPDTSNKLEVQAGLLFKLLLGKRKVEEIDFPRFKKEILDYHSPGSNLKKIVTNRLDALEYYLRGNLDKCELSLHAAFEKAEESKNIPNWVKNDIAIDARNIALLRVGKDDNYSDVEFGQEVLNSSEEPIYFPVLDRAVASFYENIFGNLMKERNKSPFLVRLNGDYFAIRFIADSYIISLVYGSITHVMLLRNKLGEYLQILSLNSYNHRTFVAAVEVLLLRGDEKGLENYIDSYTYNTNFVDENDVLRWNDAISSLRIKPLRLRSEILLLSKFGYYFNEEHFNDLLEKVNAKILAMIDEGDVWGFAEYSITTSYLMMLSDVKYRISPKDMIRVAKCFRKHEMSSWYDDVFKMLASIDCSKMQPLEIESYINWLIDCCKDTELKTCRNLLNAIYTIRFNCSSSLCSMDVDNLDGVINREFPSFYEEIYRIDLMISKGGDLEGIFSDQLSMLSNITSGLKGESKRLDLIDRVFYAIDTIFDKQDGRIKESEILNMFDVFMHILRSEKQLYIVKCKIVEQLIEISISSKDSLPVKNILCEIKKDRKAIARGEKNLLLKGYSEKLLVCLLDLLEIVEYTATELEVIRHLSQVYELEDAEALLYLGYIREIIHTLSVKKLKFIEAEGILQYVLRESKSRNKQARVLALGCLLDYIEIDPMYSDFVLDIMSKAMDTEASDIKASIVKRVCSMDHEDSKVQFILEKAKSDNNYHVRSFAED